jgi:hypothetical protein
MNPKFLKEQTPSVPRTSHTREVSHGGRPVRLRCLNRVLRWADMCTRIANVLLLVLLLCARPSVARAQNSGLSWPAERDDAEGNLPTGSNPLLSPDEGLDILGVALDTRHRLTNDRDCSHLVHALYERAGFPYPYSNSLELYAGIEQFQPVMQPQPGDLIVWHGHVGIIVSPVRRSFLSALRSGRGVEKYDSPYWRRRGRPRFFRYVKGSPSLPNLSTSAN